MEQEPGGSMPRGPMSADPGMGQQMPQQMPGQGAGPMSGNMGGDPNAATPEEQQQYDQIVAKAYDLIYDNKTMPAIVETLKGEGDPIEGLARTTSSVMLRVIQSGMQANVPINGEVAFHAGTEVFEDLADLSREAGVKDYTQDQDGMEKAYFLALDYSRQAFQDAGILDPAAADADLQALQKMDQDGQLEQMMMGLAERDAGGRQPQSRGLMTAGA
ncbi:MAG: hypothetical protein M9944_13080 [Rhizobiaceae bacterium]|nr:hypothetical protein [Rhizobiaceae bacterium]